MLTNITWHGDKLDELICYADNKKTAIKFHFNDSGEVTWFSVDQTEFYSNDENLFDLFVCVNGEIVSLYELMLKAQGDYQSIRKESEDNDFYESQHRREISSLEATGRI